MQKVLVKRIGFHYNLGMTKETKEMEELENFMKELQELRLRYPNVVISSESGFEAVEASVNQQIVYIS
jgi:hypothetical protein